MRVLAATIGALLISVSIPALAQEPNRDQPQCQQQQLEEPGDRSVSFGLTDQPAEPLEIRQPEQAERQQRELEELLARLPDPLAAQQAEMQNERQQRELEELLARLPDPLAMRQAAMQDERQPRELEELLARLPDPLAAQQAEMQNERQQRELEELLARLPESPADRSVSFGMTDQSAERPQTRQPAQAELQQRELEAFLARLPERPAAQQAEMQEEPRQPEAMKAELEQAPMRAAAMEMPDDPEWAAVTDPSLGTTMDLPRAVFSMADGHAHKGVGRKYKTPDGRAKVAVWTQSNARRDTPASYLRRTFVIPRAAVDYERFTPDFAVVSGVYSSRIFYLRCNLSRRGNLHCFDLTYPVRERKAWDAVVTRMSHSLRPFS